MNGSLNHNSHSAATTKTGADRFEQSTLDGVIFVGLCVMCAAILLMVIKLCYNYTRNFPVSRGGTRPSMA